MQWLVSAFFLVSFGIPVSRCFNVRYHRSYRHHSISFTFLSVRFGWFFPDSIVNCRCLLSNGLYCTCYFYTTITVARMWTPVESMLRLAHRATPPSSSPSFYQRNDYRVSIYWRCSFIYLLNLNINWKLIKYDTCIISRAHLRKRWKVDNIVDSRGLTSNSLGKNATFYTPIRTMAHIGRFGSVRFVCVLCGGVALCCLWLCQWLFVQYARTT